MKRKLSLLILLMSFSFVFSQNKALKQAQKFIDTKGEVTFTFKIKDIGELNVLSNELSIVNYDPLSKTVKVWANKKQFENFLLKGVVFDVNPSDNQPADDFNAKSQISNSSRLLATPLTFPLTNYPSYQDYADQMALFASNNPTICQLVDIGGTGEGSGGGNKRLLFVKLSDNVSSQEQEPRVMFTSSMHGDEITGYVLMLDLIDYFLTAYNNTSHPDHLRIKNLLDNSEVWINPLANPDGTYYGDPNNISVANARRGNVNGLDLNRNYPDPSGVLHPDGQAYQVETLNFMALESSKHFVISANFHGGAEVVNYPWDYTYARHPDDIWYQLISNEYADQVQADGANNGFPNYFTSITSTGITHGADWYLVNGGRQDYMNYYKQCKEVTIEVSNIKTPSASLLDDYWYSNKEALINYLIQGTYGFRGVVKDATTGNPIQAKITLVGHDALGSWTTTELPFGDYYRPINAGTYDLLFEADCYQPFTLNGQTIGNYEIKTLPDVLLSPIASTPPSGLLVSNVNSTTATLSWNAINGANYDYRYRAIGSATWITINTSNNSVNLTGLMPSTDYEAQIRSSCNSNTSPYSNSINFTTTEISYCSSEGSNSSNEYISRVQLNTINNSSGSQVYSDFTAITTTLTKGTQYTVTITPSWNGRSQREGYSVWIDYNKNGSFSDSGEQVLAEFPTKSSTISASFSVPAYAVESSLRMRVSMERNNTPLPCGTLNNGEVEDYTIIIQGTGPDITAPSAPTNLFASGITQNSADLSWNASTDNVGVTGYDILRNSVVIASTTGTTYQVTGLTATTSYVFNVTAKDAAGNISDLSNSVNVTTLAPPDTQAPTAPTNLSASNTTEFTTDLTWTASTDNVGVTGYDVISGSTVIATVTTTSYQITGLTPSTAYTFTIKARDLAGNISAASNSVNITTLDFVDTIAPSNPSNLSASNITQTSVNLVWTSSTDNVGVTGYKVYRDATNIGTYPSNSATISGLTPSTTYAFYVTALDAASNESASSNTINIATLAEPTCSDGIQNGDETGVDCGGSSCAPCAVSDVTIHQGYFETGWDGWTSGGNDSFYYTGSNSCEGVGSIRLRAGSGTASSMISPTFNLTPFNEIEFTFCFYSSSMSGSSDFWLRYFNGSTWTTIKTWTVDIDFNDGTFNTMTVLLNQSQYNLVSNGQFSIQCDASKKNEQIYVDQVIIKGKGGNTARLLSDSKNEINLNSTIKIYPNPVKGAILNIELLNATEINYRILNMYGQLVKTGKSKREIIVDDLQSGLYFIEIQDNGKLNVAKFIKQ